MEVRKCDAPTTVLRDWKQRLGPGAAVLPLWFFRAVPLLLKVLRNPREFRDADVAYMELRPLITFNRFGVVPPVAIRRAEEVPPAFRGVFEVYVLLSRWVWLIYCATSVVSAVAVLVMFLDATAQ